MGSAKLDEILDGGVVTGAATLLAGPSWVGKTTTALRCALSALERGQRVAYYWFDKGLHTLLSRAAVLDMDLRPWIEEGSLCIHQMDPADTSPGKFAYRVRTAVERDNIVAAVSTAISRVTLSDEVGGNTRMPPVSRLKS